MNKVSYGKIEIRRMVLHFKTDEKDRLWLLWSNSIMADGEDNVCDHVSTNI